jgi:hypothetical protein
MQGAVDEGGRAGHAAAHGGAENSARAGASTTAGRFAQALLGGNAKAAASYFSASGHCLTPDGTGISGRPAIAALLAQLTNSDHRLEIHAGRTIAADSIAELLHLNRSDQPLDIHARRLAPVEGVALCTQYWTRSAAPTGRESFRATTTARLLLEREERAWQIAIALPWG